MDKIACITDVSVINFCTSLCNIGTKNRPEVKYGWWKKESETSRFWKKKQGIVRSKEKSHKNKHLNIQMLIRVRLLVGDTTDVNTLEFGLCD